MIRAFVETLLADEDGQGWRKRIKDGVPFSPSDLWRNYQHFKNCKEIKGGEKNASFSTPSSPGVNTSCSSEEDESEKVAKNKLVRDFKGELSSRAKKTGIDIDHIFKTKVCKTETRKSVRKFEVQLELIRSARQTPSTQALPPSRSEFSETIAKYASLQNDEAERHKLASAFIELAESQPQVYDKIAIAFLF